MGTISIETRVKEQTLPQVYSWGSGSYGRLGLGHSADVHLPERLGGQLAGRGVVRWRLRGGAHVRVDTARLHRPALLVPRHPAAVEDTRQR